MGSGYRVLLTKGALKDLEKLPLPLRQRVGAAIDRLRGAGGRPPGVKKLGITGWRLRVGDYRILYEIEDDKKVITIYRIRHRREAYRS
jgi:mRNA interferase RelE/StbE